MNIVKRLRESSLLSLRKKHYYRRNQSTKAYLSTIMFASLVGTYLDLLLVGAGRYSFPSRPFSEIFTINILFTLFILPVFSFLIILVLKRLHPISRYLLLFICSLFVYIAEQIAEQFGLFIHSTYWKHEFSLFGYLLFFIVIWKFYSWQVSHR